MNNPTLVQSLSLMLPLVDVDDVYTNELWGMAAKISRAYGGAPANGENPAENTASFAGMPIRMWASPDDSICRWTPVNAFATATGADLINIGAQGGLGHSLNGMDLSQLVEWVLEND
jgi:hypothetical protein